MKKNKREFVQIELTEEIKIALEKMENFEKYLENCHYLAEMIRAQIKFRKNNPAIE